MSENTPADAPRGGPTPHRHHGQGLRGADLSRRSVQFEGRFGRMFRTLPAAHFSPQSLQDLARVTHMTATLDDPQTPETEIDDEENVGTPGDPGISAGYTYWGQFIDHDLTFDPASSLQRQNDPDALTDFRTPRFDLDNLYGRGPDDQPYLYADDGLHMLLGQPVGGSAFDPNTRDLPRNTPNPGEPARALIGDPRNDENGIVSQLQSTFLRFHNQVADTMASRTGRTPTFEAVQRAVRWHYQWAVLHDFLPTVIGADAVASILPQFGTAEEGIAPFTPQLHSFHWKDQPYMPVEFSTAAYRFGHSMIRPIYRLNTNIDRLTIFPVQGGDPAGALTGFRALGPNRAVDWTLFFPIEGRPALGPTRVQPAYKIDTSLVNPLAFLPDSIATVEHSLAARNLLRGMRMGLPSGQSVARAMGLPVIPDDDLRVGKANESDFAGNTRLADISPEFTDNAPLWYYVLAEAMQAFQSNTTPIRLGPVGGRIVGEVFIGLLWGDSHSYLQQHPGWRPFDEFTRDGQFGMAELILQARQSVSQGRFIMAPAPGTPTPGLPVSAGAAEAVAEGQTVGAGV